MITAQPVLSGAKPCSHVCPSLRQAAAGRFQHQRAGLSTPALGRPAGSRLACRASAAVANRPGHQQQRKLDISKMEPLGDRLLVRLAQEKQTTEGGLVLTGAASRAFQEARIGEVLAKGDSAELPDVNAGDTVIFSKYSTTDVKVEDVDVCFVAAKSVLACLS